MLRRYGHNRYRKSKTSDEATAKDGDLVMEGKNGEAAEIADIKNFRKDLPQHAEMLLK